MSSLRVWCCTGSEWAKLPKDYFRNPSLTRECVGSLIFEFLFFNGEWGSE